MGNGQLQEIGRAARNTARLTNSLGTSVSALLAQLEALLETALSLAEQARGLDVGPLLQQARDLSAAAERLRDLLRAGDLTTTTLETALGALGLDPTNEAEVVFLDWSPELSVLVDSMDEQHRGLIGHLNRLYGAILSGGHHLGVRETVIALQEYTARHFRDEEALMEAHGFPDCALQRAQHAAFSARVAEFAQQVDDGATLDAQVVLAFLKDWLVNHIQKCDRCYGEYFRDKKIAVD